MKSKQSHKGLTVWLVCLVFILIITVGAVLLGRRYGLVGIAALFLGAIVSLQIYKMIYEWFALHKDYKVDLVRRITDC
jgi:4-amino-4-deoxy-L-arabinose transferase-like glycosyltransferase